MATDTWIALANGNWTTGADWSTGAEPGFADLALLLSPVTLSVSSFVIPGALAIGSVSTLDLQNGAFLDAISAVTSQGVIEVDGNSTFGVEINTPTFDNAGSVVVGANASLDISSAQFTNTGTIVIGAGAQVSLELQSTLAALPSRLGTITNNGAPIDITLEGTIANTGTIFDFAQANALGVTGLGSLFSSATIQGGTLDAGDGSLVFSLATLDNVTILGPLTLPGGMESLTFTDGVTFTGSSGNGAGVINAPAEFEVLAFTGTTTLDGATLNVTSAQPEGQFGQVGQLTLGAPGSTDLLTLGAHLVVDVHEGTGPAVLRVNTAQLVHNLGSIVIDPNAGSLLVQANVAASTPAFINDGVISIGAGDRASFMGAYSGAGTIDLLGGAQVSFTSVANGAIDLTGTANTVVLGSSSFGGTLSGLAIGDVLNFAPGLTVTAAVFASGGVFAFNGGTLVEIVATTDDLTGDNFNVTADNGTGAIVSIACFAAGTRILTARGEVAVEALQVGDLIRLASGGIAPIRWLGHRRIDCRRHPRPQDVLPVRVRADAFGPGLPVRDLRLSPDHAVYVAADADAAGILIPIRYLLNGHSIVQEQVPDVTYYHLELSSHDVILAEGLACESYLDTGNRAAFANAGPAVMLHPDFARAVWSRKACAELVLDGPRVAAVKRRLLAEAALGGALITADADLRVVVDGMVIPVHIEGPTWHAHLPISARRVRLVSRTWVPAHMRDENDTRSLGVAISGLCLDGREVPLDDARLSSGWHAAESAWRWTNGDAGLALAGVREMSFRPALSGSYWAKGRTAARAYG